MEFTTTEIILTALIFVWTGFVRSGLGFGGAALGLPLMLLVGGTPLYWLPIIGLHLLFFSSLTIFDKLSEVDWQFMGKSLFWILPASLIGVAGLVTLPTKVMVIFIYSVTFIYALIWVFDKQITSQNKWLDRFLLSLGGYVAGTSLTGAPLIVAVYLRHVDKIRLRSTLLALWFILVSIKMATLVAFEVVFDWRAIFLLIPVSWLGHLIGLKLHQRIIENDALFKKIVGGALLLISTLGLIRVLA